MYSISKLLLNHDFRLLRMDPLLHEISQPSGRQDSAAGPANISIGSRYSHRPPDRDLAGGDASNLAYRPADGDSANMAPEDLLRSASDICPFAVVMVEPLGKIVLANDELERMFGYAHGELVGQAIEILVPAELRTQHARHRDQIAAHPEIRLAKNRIVSGRRKDGSEFSAEIGLKPIPTRDGVLILGVIADFSDRSRVEMLKNEFVATVSHELRTPLTSIAGALGLLAGNAGGSLPGPAMRLITIAHTNCQRLVRLVNSILAMEKIESGKVVFVLQRIELHSVVREAIEANQAFAEAHGVRMRLDAASAPGEIRADPDWLAQVLTNLLSNAIKFSPPGEEVVVGIEQRDSAVRISVRDHGRGIPEAFKPHIFQKFAQADASDARKLGGTGLGLSIVKQIVTRLGGQVDFADAPDGGTIFHVELPGSEPAIDAAPEFVAEPMARRLLESKPDVPQ
jgi:PAS domain S-box-containing protein